MSGIYSITNLIDNKRYIGQAKTIKTRFTDHKSALRNNRHFNVHLQNAWNKYGEENFIFEVLEECLFEELDEKEQYYIKKYDSMNPQYGYNRNSGGNLNKQMSEESKRKVSESLMGHPVSEETLMKLRESHKGKHLSEEAKKKVSLANKGKTVSEETRKKLSIINIGRKVSEETREKLSKAHLGKKWSKEQHEKVDGKFRGVNNPNYGLKRSDETKRKISEAKKGMIPWNKGKKMSKDAIEKHANAIRGRRMPCFWKAVIDVTNNIVYPSVRDAQDATGIMHIDACARGERKHAGGIEWKYLDTMQQHED